jgi:hypothetical protein
MDKESILDEAKRIVHGDRGENYGHPFEDFSRTAQIWSAILGTEVTPENVALCMVGLKISREVNRPKRDNIVDGAGYFETLQMVKDERKRRKIKSLVEGAINGLDMSDKSWDDYDENGVAYWEK